MLPFQGADFFILFLPKHHHFSQGVAITWLCRWANLCWAFSPNEYMLQIFGWIFL